MSEGYTFTVSVVFKGEIYYRYHSRISAISLHQRLVGYSKILNSLTKETFSYQIHVFNGPDVYLQSPFLFDSS
jgi:hypothetical protein